MINLNGGISKFTNQAIFNAGYDLYQLNNVLVSNNDEAVQAIIDNYDPLPEAKAEAIEAINKRANELIVADMPVWKQINSNRAISTLKGNGGTMSAADLLAVAVLDAEFLYLDAVRAQSDIDVALIEGQTDWTLCVPDFTVMEAIS